jgi:hypothetical protein
VASDFGKKAQSTTFIILLVVGVVAAVIVQSCAGNSRRFAGNFDSCSAGV